MYVIRIELWYLYAESKALLLLLSINLLLLIRLLPLTVAVCVKVESTLGALRSSTAESRLTKHCVSVSPYTRPSTEVE